MIETEALSEDVKARMRISYALKRVPSACLARLAPLPAAPETGDIVLARVEKIGKNGGLELPTGRRATLHEGDLIAVVFGNRYATHQFEGYARADGDRCHMLSMGGLCGMVQSKHGGVAEPTKLRLLGALADDSGRVLHLRDFGLPATPVAQRPGVIAVCGSSMDSGKTHTTMSLIVGLRAQGYRVAGIKLTGTSAGRDVWSMVDAGACIGLDFVDGGFPSTYLTSLNDLELLHEVLVTQAGDHGAEWAVVEIADGLFQRETAALLRSPSFTATVNAWVLAASEPMAAAAAVTTLRGWGIEPVAISGVVSMSPLGMRETEAETGLSCFTAQALQAGALNGHFDAALASTLAQHTQASVAAGE
jgi:hypothetical protein